MSKHLITLCILLSACTPYIIIGKVQKDTKATPSSKPAIANPASEYCVSQENTLIIRQDSQGSQVGYCLFQDQTECEEWAYFQGTCQPGQHPSAQ